MLATMVQTSKSRKLYQLCTDQGRGLTSKRSKIKKLLKDGASIIIGLREIIASLKTGQKVDHIDAGPLVDLVSDALSGSASWNHGKILAVGGKTMMTGGMNPWAEYTAQKPQIIDLSIKITGDATTSAHAYADYFWKYARFLIYW
jgi:hypothetical protein